MGKLFEHKFGACNWYTDAYSRICTYSKCSFSSYYFDRMELTAFPLLSWWPKSLLAKVVKFFSLLAMIVTSAQMGVVGLIMRGEHIFPMIGIANTPAGALKLAAIWNRLVHLQNIWLQYHITLYAAILPNAKRISVKLSKANTSQRIFFAGVLYIKRKRFAGEIKLRWITNSP
ncbi:hypothetical protein Bca4012_056737 [Brassica carinata]